MSSPHDLASSLKAAAESLRPTIQATRAPLSHVQPALLGRRALLPVRRRSLWRSRRTIAPKPIRSSGKLVDGRYEVESVLGEGGMGTVYAVRHRALGKRFALKVLRADLARDGELAARFIREAKAAAAIGHPNIVADHRLRSSSRTGAPYFVMELLDGISLSSCFATGGPLPAASRGAHPSASRVGARRRARGGRHPPRSQARQRARQRNDDDVVKVLDFGVAKMAGAGRLTRTGMVFGTPHYMSPEQARAGDVDHRADVYALGIIMYEMFTGRVPFEADTYMGVLTKHMFMVPERSERGEPRGARARRARRRHHAVPREEARGALRVDGRAHPRNRIDRAVHGGLTGDPAPLAWSSRSVRAPMALADELEPPASGEPRAEAPVAGRTHRPFAGSLGARGRGRLVLLGSAAYARATSLERHHAAGATRRSSPRRSPRCLPRPAAPSRYRRRRCGNRSPRPSPAVARSPPTSAG